MRRAASLCHFMLPLAAAGRFAARFRQAQSGQFTQGGMVVLHLHEAVTVTLNGETLPQIDGRTV